MPNRKQAKRKVSLLLFFSDKDCTKISRLTTHCNLKEHELGYVVFHSNTYSAQKEQHTEVALCPHRSSVCCSFCAPPVLRWNASCTFSSQIICQEEYTKEKPIDGINRLAPSTASCLSGLD